MDFTDKLTTAFALVCLAIGLACLINLGAINDWERAHGYPYGKMCQVFGGCK